MTPPRSRTTRARSSRGGPAPQRGRTPAAALGGLLAGAVAVALSELVTGLLSGVTSPLLAVANRVVDETPRPLKEWAIEHFGSADKTVLVSSVVVGVAALAALVGVLAARRPSWGVTAFLGLSLVATVAATTDRSATAGTTLRLLPVLVLVVAGLLALALVTNPLLGSRDRQAGVEDPARPGPGPREGKQRLLLPSHTDQDRLLPHRVPGDDLPPAFDRRAFLKAAAAVGVVAAAGGLATSAVSGSDAAASRASLDLPAPAQPATVVPAGAQLDVPGISPFITSNRDFYRVDTALQVPDVPLGGFRLRVHGMVERELDLSFADLLDRPLLERRITLTCVSNQVGGPYVGNAAWLGLLVKDLLEEAGVRDGADAVKSTSADGMTIGTPLQALLDDRGAMIAVGMNGEPLPLEHGFPVRMVVPGLYGYVSATKWLVDLEVTRFADFKAYWTTRGYSAQAPIKTESRIDVPKAFAQVPAGKAVVAGVAWAQDTGIAKVEVRADDGEWAEARLADEDSIDTWRQWVYEWDAKPGLHRLEVRATDRSGYRQTDARAPIAPDGATGWHSVNVTVT